MSLIGTRMVSDGKTARQLFEEVMANPARKKFGFGEQAGDGQCRFPARLYPHRPLHDRL